MAEDTPCYKFAEKAERDLEDTIDYTLQQWGPVQTHTYLDGLEARGQLLADNPDLGTKREAISEGLLSFPYESHILYHMKQPHGITIVQCFIRAWFQRNTSEPSSPKFHLQR